MEELFVFPNIIYFTCPQLQPLFFLWGAAPPLLVHVALQAALTTRLHGGYVI